MLCLSKFIVGEYLLIIKNILYIHYFIRCQRRSFTHNYRPFITEKNITVHSRSSYHAIHFIIRIHINDNALTCRQIHGKQFFFPCQFKTDVCLWIKCRKLFEPCIQKSVHDRRAGIDDDPSFLLGAALPGTQEACFFVQGRHTPHDILDQGEQFPSLWSKGCASRNAGKKTHPQLSFKQFDRFAQRRLADMQVFRSHAEGPETHYCQKKFKLLQAHKLSVSLLKIGGPPVPPRTACR